MQPNTSSPRAIVLGANVNSGSDYTLAVSVTAFPDGSFEGSAMLRPAWWKPGADAGGQPVGARARAARGDDADAYREVNRRRSVRRSRKLLIRHVRHQACDCLGTLTFGGDVLPDPYDALGLAVEWWRSAGRDLIGDIPCVFVPEHGEVNGRIHVHLGFRRAGRRLDYRGIIRSWSAFLSARGYRSPVGTHRVHFSRSLPSRRLSLYLAKYLGKALDAVEVPAHAHRFRSVRCEAVKPVWVAAVPSIEALCGALGISSRSLHRYERRREDGSVVLVGFGFEGG